MKVTYTTENDIKLNDGRIIKRGEELTVDLDVQLSIKIEERVRATTGELITSEIARQKDAIRLTGFAEKIVNDLTATNVWATLCLKNDNIAIISAAIHTVSLELTDMSPTGFKYRGYTQAMVILENKLSRAECEKFFLLK